VDGKKFEKIVYTAEKFIKDYGALGSKRYRIDVISVSKDGTVDHFIDIASEFS
jgi:Holliday junction resolvase-like predicted endonuclease